MFLLCLRKLTETFSSFVVRTVPGAGSVSRRKGRRTVQSAQRQREAGREVGSGELKGSHQASAERQAGSDGFLVPWSSLPAKGYWTLVAFVPRHLLSGRRQLAVGRQEEGPFLASSAGSARLPAEQTVPPPISRQTGISEDHKSMHMFARDRDGGYGLWVCPEGVTQLTAKTRRGNKLSERSTPGSVDGDGNASGIWRLDACPSGGWRWCACAGQRTARGYRGPHPGGWQ